MVGKGLSQVSESEITPEALKAFESEGARLFRNNIGVARFGKRWVAYGVGGKGAADHVGYLPVRITPEMVGHFVAVFIAPELKRPVNGHYDPKQVEWRDCVLAAGGIAGFVKSWQDARTIVANWRARFKSVKPKQKKLVRRIKNP